MAFSQILKFLQAFQQLPPTQKISEGNEKQESLSSAPRLFLHTNLIEEWYHREFL